MTPNVTENFGASGQIQPGDLPILKAAGYTTIICNRPDAEVPLNLSSMVMRQAAEDAGLQFHYIPVGHSGLGMAEVEAERNALQGASGPVFAYCAAGMRATTLWALGMAGKMPTEDILAAAADAGVNLGHLRGAIDSLAQ